jgi:hypothetical protein
MIVLRNFNAGLQRLMIIVKMQNKYFVLSYGSLRHEPWLWKTRNMALEIYPLKNNKN